MTKKVKARLRDDLDDYLKKHYQEDEHGSYYNGDAFYFIPTKMFFLGWQEFDVINEWYLKYKHMVYDKNLLVFEDDDKIDITDNYTSEYIRIMEAYKAGKIIQLRHREHKDKWEDIFRGLLEPSWNFEMFQYRIKPTLRLRQWSLEELMKHRHCKFKIGDICDLRLQQINIGYFNANHIFQDKIELSFENPKSPNIYGALDTLLESFEWFDEETKEWKPCGVMEAE
jgi:hypothetical protein